MGVGSFQPKDAPNPTRNGQLEKLRKGARNGLAENLTREGLDRLNDLCDEDCGGE